MPRRHRRVLRCVALLPTLPGDLRCWARGRRRYYCHRRCRQRLTLFATAGEALTWGGSACILETGGRAHDEETRQPRWPPSCCTSTCTLGRHRRTTKDLVAERERQQPAASSPLEIAVVSSSCACALSRRSRPRTPAQPAPTAEQLCRSHFVAVPCLLLCSLLYALSCGLSSRSGYCAALRKACCLFWGNEPHLPDSDFVRVAFSHFQGKPQTVFPGCQEAPVHAGEAKDVIYAPAVVFRSRSSPPPPQLASTSTPHHATPQSDRRQTSTIRVVVVPCQRLVRFCPDPCFLSGFGVNRSCCLFSRPTAVVYCCCCRLRPPRSPLLLPRELTPTSCAAPRFTDSDTLTLDQLRLWIGAASSGVLLVLLIFVREPRERGERGREATERGRARSGFWTFFHSQKIDGRGRGEGEGEHVTRGKQKMAGTSPHLPSVTAVSVDTLFLVVMVCVLIEVSDGRSRSGQNRCGKRERLGGKSGTASFPFGCLLLS